MNKFCVGQKVIGLNERKIFTVTALRGEGVIVLDGKIEDVESAYQIEPEFMDKTNYFYHHMKFSQGCTLIEEGIREYMLALDEMKNLVSYPGESAFMMRARTMCQTWIDEAAAKLEKGLAWKRTAEYNSAQWAGLTLDHHFPFINSEGEKDY